jgi:hypothetical protein
MTGLQVLLIIVVTSFVLSPSIAVSSAEKSDSPRDITVSPYGPVVSGTNRNSTFISVIADRACNPAIRYANDSYFSLLQNYNHEIFSSHSGSNHSIRITDLEPATKYHYQVRGCGVQDIDRTFFTFPVTGSCTFIVYGDTREQEPIYNQTERHKLVADRMAQEKNILFVINSGDLVSESNDPAEWSRFFDATEKVRSTTTYNAVPGNHDSNRTLFEQLFWTDKPNFIDCGDARIALLDSTDLSSVPLQEQAEWLTSAFGSFKGAKIAIFHHPVYSSDEEHYGGWLNIQTTLVPVFQKSGVKLVFNSHVHAFEQVVRDGITYITEARGGAPAYPLNKTRILGSVRTYENTLGYSRVTITPSSGAITIDVIRVADVSDDLRSITRLYPPGVIDAKIIIPSGSSSTGFPDIGDLMCGLVQNNHSSGTFLNYVKS